MAPQKSRRLRRTARLTPEVLAMHDAESRGTPSAKGESSDSLDLAPVKIDAPPEGEKPETRVMDAA